MPDTRLSFKEMCARFDVTPRTLRYYEYIELLQPEKDGRARFYGPREVARMTLILRGRRIGFSLLEIQEMLDLYDNENHNAHQMSVALRRHRAQIAALKQQREDLDAAIETAEEACAVMERKLAEFRPDLLPGADEYADLLKSRLNADPLHQPFKARA